MVVIARLVKDSEVQKRWGNFCKEILKFELNFKDEVEVIIDFTWPPFKAMVDEDELFKTWSHKDKKYI